MESYRNSKIHFQTMTGLKWKADLETRGVSKALCSATKNISQNLPTPSLYFSLRDVRHKALSAPKSSSSLLKSFPADTGFVGVNSNRGVAPVCIINTRATGSLSSAKILLRACNLCQ